MPNDEKCMNCAGILLAAGASRRLGRAKQLLSFDGETLVHRAARVLLESGCAPLIVVLGAVDAECRAALKDLPVQIVMNENWRDGMGSSISVAISELARQEIEVEATIIAVCDQPFLSAELIRALIHQHEMIACSIVASDYGDALGPPAFFGAAHFSELAHLRGEQGARRLFQAHATARVHFAQGRADIDTPEDWRALSEAG